MTVSRRTVLLGGAGLLGTGLLAACGQEPTGSEPPPPSVAPAEPPPVTSGRLAALEDRFGGRLGVAATDLATGVTVGHRADERFLLCSTGKVPTVGAVLRRDADEPGLLDREVRYTPAQVVTYSPVTGRTGALTVAQLCEAALTVSDNTAENLLLDQLGGPSAVTGFVRTLGDAITRLDRPEPALNQTTPGDERDTTTPAAMTRVLRALLLGDALPPAARDRLTGWMVANTPGAAQIRAGVPAGWRVADKTGSGAQGESNDVGVVWPPGDGAQRSSTIGPGDGAQRSSTIGPGDGAQRSSTTPAGRAPVVVAVYTSPTDPRNTGKEAIAEATRIVVAALVGAR